MNIGEWVTVFLIAAGAFFFFAGSIGLLRFPDVYTRLHALTKADNTGLGLIVIGLMLQAPSLLSMVKMLLIWILVMFSGATVCHLVARSALRGGVVPWRKND